MVLWGAGVDPGFLELGVQPLKKGTLGGGAAPLASAEGAKVRAGGGGPPQKNMKIKVLICVFLASGKILRLS
jgi:hypothetical protein